MNSREAIFAASPDLSTWTQYKGGASTVVLSNGNKTATIVNDGARAFIYKDIAVVDTDWIYISAVIDSADPVFDTDSFGDAQIVTVEQGVADGDQSYKITSLDDGKRVGILFQPYSGRTTVRLRIGPGAASTGEAGTLVFSDVTVQQFDSEPTNVDKYYDVSGATFPHTVYTDTDAASTYLAGAVTEAVPLPRAVHDLSRILDTGDSYGLQERYPDKVIADLDAALSPNVHHLFRDHIGGTNLEEINTRLPGSLDGSAFNIPAELHTPYQAVVLGTVGGNSVLDQVPAATIITQLDAFIATVRAEGITNIILVGVPPFKAYPSWTQGKQDIADTVRTTLGSVYDGLHVVETFNLLESPNQPEYLADDAAHGDPADYTNNSGSDGDGLHANWTPIVNGHQVLADEVVTLLQLPPVVSVHQDIDLQWSMLNAVQQDADLRWSLLNTVQQDADLRWSILNAVQQDIDLQWSMLNAVQQDADLRWSLLNTVQQDADLRWSLLNAVQQDADLRWSILNAVSNDADLRWAILQSAQQDINLRWDIVSATHNDLTLQWSIESETNFPDLTGTITVNTLTPVFRIESLTPQITVH